MALHTRRILKGHRTVGVRRSRRISKYRRRWHLKLFSDGPAIPCNMTVTFTSAEQVEGYFGVDQNCTFFDQGIANEPA